MEWVIARLKEVSTWQGIITLVTGFGVAISPELSEGIITAGVAIVGVISVAMREKEGK